MTVLIVDFAIHNLDATHTHTLCHQVATRSSFPGKTHVDDDDDDDDGPCMVAKWHDVGS